MSRIHLKSVMPDYSIVIKIIALGIAIVFGLIAGHKVASELYQLRNKYLNVQKIVDSRPTYDYLKSVTVYVMQVEGTKEDGSPRGGVGTGVVVAGEDGYFYILTNKHVCDEADNGKCFVTENKTSSIKFRLTYIGHAKDDVDLSLWKINILALPDKQVIKGFNFANIQDRVYNVGNYLAIPFIYAEGTVAGFDDGYLIANMPCAPGCSGSGVFNDKGELVGLIRAGHIVATTFELIGSMDTSKCVAVNMTEIQEFLKTQGLIK